MTGRLQAPGAGQVPVQADLHHLPALIGGQPGVFPATVVTASQVQGLGAAMDRGTRWLLAGVVTVAAFLVPTVVCGVWLLPTWLKDGPTCWAVASGLGVAVAALAALWGHGFASGGEAQKTAAEPDTGSATASGNRAVAIQGPVKGNISTGDSGVPHSAPDAFRRGSTPAEALSQQQEPGPDREPAPGSATASGERAVAVNGGLEGDVSTGDRLDSEPQQ
jgi:hypothetical protein